MIWIFWGFRAIIQSSGTLLQSFGKHSIFLESFELCPFSKEWYDPLLNVWCQSLWKIRNSTLNFKFGPLESLCCGGRKHVQILFLSKRKSKNVPISSLSASLGIFSINLAKSFLWHADDWNQFQHSKAIRLWNEGAKPKWAFFVKNAWKFIPISSYKLLHRKCQTHWCATRIFYFILPLWLIASIFVFDFWKFAHIKDTRRQHYTMYIFHHFREDSTHIYWSIKLAPFIQTHVFSLCSIFGFAKQVTVRVVVSCERVAAYVYRMLIILILIVATKLSGILCV